MTTIPIRVARTILDEIEAVYDDVTKRAYEKFLDRGGTCTLERHGHLIVRLQLGGVDPKVLNVLLTPDDAIVQSVEPYPKPRIFRTVHFPFPVNTAGARACWARGRLILVVLKAVNGLCEGAPEPAASEALHIARK
jgi:hypothetical protein